jgi:hypothetical protein
MTSLMIWRHGPRKLAERLHVTTSPARSQAAPPALAAGATAHCNGTAARLLPWLPSQWQFDHTTTTTALNIPQAQQRGCALPAPPPP